MTNGYSAEERRRLEDAVANAGPVACPACGAVLAQRKVPVPAEVSYVRRRVLLICPGCRRSAAVDVRAGGQP